MCQIIGRLRLLPPTSNRFISMPDRAHLNAVAPSDHSPNQTYPSRVLEYLQRPLDGTGRGTLFGLQHWNPLNWFYKLGK